MAEGEPNDKPRAEGGPSDPSGKPGELPRRRFLTPEQRRVLGAGPAWSDHPQPSAEPATDPASTAEAAVTREEIEHGTAEPRSTSLEEEAEPALAGERHPAPQPASRKLTTRESVRVFQLGTIAMVVGSLLLLGTVFYLGTRVPHWLYLYRSHQRQALQQSLPGKFPGASSDELVERALDAQAAGRWREAGERFLEARRKNNSYRGIFFRVGLLSLEHRDIDTADSLFGTAIAAGENLEGANSFRAKIALRRHDYAAAERFAQAATMAAPFVWTNYHEWAEILRMNHKPREAIRRYEQASRRAPPGLAVSECLYKVRLARIEAKDATIGEEIARMKSNGPLPPDWLATEAALKIDQGHFGDAAQLLTEARAAATASTFSSYVNDALFQNAAQNDPSLAAICRIKNPSPAPSP